MSIALWSAPAFLQIVQLAHCKCTSDQITPTNCEQPQEWSLLEEPCSNEVHDLTDEYFGDLSVRWLYISEIHFAGPTLTHCYQDACGTKANSF